MQKFPRNLYLADKENQRKFFDEMARDYKIKDPSEWGQISEKQVEERGGTLILKHRSLEYALKRVYPGIRDILRTDLRSQKYHGMQIGLIIDIQQHIGAI